MPLHYFSEILSDFSRKLNNKDTCIISLKEAVVKNLNNLTKERLITVSRSVVKLPLLFRPNAGISFFCRYLKLNFLTDKYENSETVNTKHKLAKHQATQI